jgi:serine protease
MQLRAIAVSACALLLAALVAATGPAGAATVDSAESSDPPTQRLIVKFRDDASASLRAMSAQDRVARLSADMNIGLMSIRTMALGAHVVARDRTVPMAEARAIASRLAASADVEYVEPDRRMRALFDPNDPLLIKQAYLGNTTAAISAFGAWDITPGSSNTVVAVIDTGCRPHADLAGASCPATISSAMWQRPTMAMGEPRRQRSG